MEKPFRNFYLLFYWHLINFCLSSFSLLSFIMNYFSTPTHCQWEQILIQFLSIFLFSNICIFSVVRRMNSFFSERSSRSKIICIFLIFFMNIFLQIIFTSIWILKNSSNFDSFSRCSHSRSPLIFSIFILIVSLLINIVNVDHFRRRLAVAFFLEAFLNSIGLTMIVVICSIHLFFSTYSKMPFQYVTFIVLLTFSIAR